MSSDRSIFSVPIGSANSWASEDQPVPKSSIATRTPEAAQHGELVLGAGRVLGERRSR